MAHLGDFYQQLKQRRVIRTALVYVALVWGALQVADLLAKADFISEFLVRALILGALLGFPLALVISWFFETPWRNRKQISIVVDITVILVVASAVLALAWQQYFKSFSRPTLAIVRIEPTDTHEDTDIIGKYLASRLSLAFISRPEVSLTALSSSFSPLLRGMSLAQKARALQADLLLTGTLNQGQDELRLNLQLYNAEGALIWNERFENRMVELARLELRALEGLRSALPLPANAFDLKWTALFDCSYPTDVAAIRTILQTEARRLTGKQATEVLTTAIERHEDNGLLYLARARNYYYESKNAPPTRRPVLNSLAGQDLQSMSAICPNHPAATLARLHNHARLLKDAAEVQHHLGTYPNDVFLLLEMARARAREGNRSQAAAYAWSAWLIDPLGDETACAAVQVLEAAGSDRRLQAIINHDVEFLAGNERSCSRPRSIE